MKIVGILLGLVLLAVPFYVDALQEENVVTRNGTQLQITIENFATATGAFSLDLDKILIDYEYKEIIKRDILNFISEKEFLDARMSVEPKVDPDPVPETEPMSDYEREFGFSVETAKRMGVFKTGCEWHLSTLFKSIRAFNNEEIERSVHAYGDCAEKFYMNQAKDEAVIQSVELHDEKIELSSLYYFLLAILIAVGIPIVIPSIRKKLFEKFRHSRLS